MGHDDGKPEHPKRCYEGGRLELNVNLDRGWEEPSEKDLY